jgi:pimeloyl-ACP methyl ester carboxylesterase
VIKSSCANEPVLIPCGGAALAGILELPPNPSGLVLFALGDGAGRHAPRGNTIAEQMRRAGLATLLLGLAPADEDSGDLQGAGMALLRTRLGIAADWLVTQPETKELALGILGCGNGAAAALQFAARRPEQVAALASCGGRPDLAGADALAEVRAPTLLIIGEDDQALIEPNRRALDQIGGEKDLAVIRGATHGCEELGTLQEVARLAARWFRGYCDSSARPAGRR